MEKSKIANKQQGILTQSTSRLDRIEETVSLPRTEPNDDPELKNSPAPQDMHQWHIDNNLKLRMDFITASGGLLTAQEVSDLTGPRTANPDQDEQDLELSGKIFSVQVEGKKRFPHIQFDHETSRPRAEVARIIESLKGEYSGWSLAIWWVSANAWLSGERPIDIWPAQAERVVKSAENEAHMFSTREMDIAITARKLKILKEGNTLKRRTTERTHKIDHTRSQSRRARHTEFLAQRRWPCEPLFEAGDGSGDLILRIPEGLMKQARLRIGEAIHIVALQGTLCIWKFRKPRPLQPKLRRTLLSSRCI